MKTKQLSGETASPFRESGGRHAHSILLKSAAAALLLLLFCSVFCGAAAAADADVVKNHSEHPAETWKPISSFTELRNIQSAGYYYLTNNVTIEPWQKWVPTVPGGEKEHYETINSWHPPNGVVLCLNGHALRYKTQFSGDQQNMIVVDKECTFTLTDCQPDASNICYCPSVDGDGNLITKPVDIYCSMSTVKYTEHFDHKEPIVEFKQETVKGGVITGGVSTPDKLVYNDWDGRHKKGADKNPYVTAVKVDGGTFNMYGGTICGCLAKENGGGVYAASRVEWRDGVTHVAYGGTVNLLGGTISGNIAMKNGGGVSIEGCSYTIDGKTTITQNAAFGNGGGVYVSRLESHSPYGHYTESHRIIDSTGTFKSGSVTKNTAKVNGGGTYVDNGGHINVQGNLQIKSNSNVKNEPDNLHLQNNNALKVTGSLEGSEIGIRNPLRGQFGYGDSSYTLSTADAKSFHADIGLDTAAVRSDNTLVWKNSVIGSAVIGYNTFLYTDNPLFGDSPFAGKAEYNKDTRTLTLTNTVTLDYTLEVVASKESPLTIDLNGHTLQAKSGTSFSVITVAEKAGLILKDSVGGGKITGGNAAGGKATRGGGVYVSRNGTFILESGSITNNYAVRGGGVYLDDNSDFEMNGGSITKNTAADNGGGVYVDDSSFTVRGASVVKDNTRTGPNSKNNVYTSKPLVVFTNNGLRDGASIGITSGISPDEGRSVDVTTSTLNDNSQYFFSDNPSVYELVNAEVSGGYVVRLIPKQHTVTYDLNGGSGSTPVDSKKYGCNAEVTVADKPADMKREGFTFMGWNTAADGSGQDYKPGSTLYLKGDTTLYANWKEGAKYSVIVKSAGNGNAGVMYNIAHEVPAGTLIQGGVIPKSGYKFDHWEAVGINPTDITCTTPSGKGTFSFSFTMPAKDVTLTAHFTEKTQANDALLAANAINAFSVTYDAGGGSGTPPVDNNSYSEGDSVTVLSQGDLTKAGYTFFCWEEQIDIDFDIDGDENPDRIRLNYQPGETFGIYQNTTLYAVWKENEEEYLHDIMLLTSGHGTVSSDPAQAAAGTTVQVNVTADDGYYFVEWKDFKGITAIPGTSNPYSFTMPDNDVEVTAVFAKNQTKTTLRVTDGAALFDEEVTSAEAKNAGIDVEFAGVFGIPDERADGFCISESTNPPPSGADIRCVLTTMDITPYNGGLEVHDFSSPVIMAFYVILPNGYSIDNLGAKHYEGGVWKTLSHWALESDGKNGEYIVGVNAQSFSSFALVLLNEVQPQPSHSGSTSQGTSVWLTAEPTTAPAAPAPTETPGTPEAPSVKPVEQKPAAQTGASPAPVMGILAGLGCAAVLFGLRRK